MKPTGWFDLIFGFLLTIVIVLFALVAIINLNDHPDRATAYGVLAIMFTLWENQISNEERWK